MKSLIILFLSCLITGSLLCQNGDVTISESYNYKYDAPRTNYLSINFTAFHSTDADEYSFVNNTFSQPYKFFRGGNANFGYAAVPISLPDGVTITKVSAYVYDNTKFDFLRLRLFETKYGDGSIFKGEVETTNEFISNNVQNLIINNLDIDVNNSQKSYHLSFESSNSNTSEIRLYGVKIEYTTDRVQ